MDPVAFAAKLLLAVILIAGGLLYAGMRFLSDSMGDPDQGFLGGFGPILVGIGVTELGILLIIY